MRRQYCSAWMCMICVATALCLLHGDAVARPIQLEEKTPLMLKLKTEVKSGKSQVGSIVEYELAEAVKSSDGITLIAQGASATGRVTVSKGKKLVVSGKLAFTVEDIVAVDGTHVSLRATKEVSSRSSSPFGVGWGGFGLPIPIGSNVTAKVGTKITAYVQKSVQIDSSSTYATGHINPSDIDRLADLLSQEIEKSGELTAALEQTNAAVVPFEMIGGDSNTAVADVSEDLSTALSSKKLRLVERVQFRRVLDELKIADSGLVDTESAGKIGKLSGAKWLVLGSVSTRETSIVINARIVETETGKVLVASRVEATRKTPDQPAQNAAQSTPAGSEKQGQQK